MDIVATMSITIRTRRANGQTTEELYGKEKQGIAALESTLRAHQKAGNTVTQNGNIYTVTDAHGAFVQESEVVSSV